MSLNVTSSSSTTVSGIFKVRYPMTVMFWFNPTTGIGNTDILEFRNSGNADNFKFQVRSSGGVLRHRTLISGASPENIDINHGNADNWMVVRSVHRTSSDRVFNVLKRDGTVSTGTSTTSIAWTSDNDNIRFFGDSESTLLSHVAVWGADLPLAYAHAMIRGRHPLDFSYYRNSLVCYQPFRRGFNEPGYKAHIPVGGTVNVGATDPAVRPFIIQAASLPATFAAATGITGTGSYTAPSATFSGTGSVIITGTGSYTSPVATFAGTGSVIISGTGSYTSPAATFAGTGSVIITGTGSYSAPAATFAGTGSIIITGTGSYTAPVATFAGTGIVGIVDITGTGSYTAPVATFAGTGTVIITGTGSYTAPAATFASTGSVIITGTGAYTAPAATMSGTGTVAAAVITGTGTYTAPVATFASSGVIIITGTGSYTAPAATMTGTNITTVDTNPFILPAYDGIMVLPAYDGIMVLPK